MSEENIEQTTSDETSNETLETTEETTETQETTEETTPETSTESEKEEETTETTEEAPEEKTETPIENIDPKTIDAAEATNILQGKGYDYKELQKEFNETGDLSKETRQKLVESGISEEMLDSYIEGQKALVEKELDEIAQCVGGRANMNEVIQWAAQNLSDSEKMSINSITDKNVMMIVLENLRNRMEAKEGKVPETSITGDGTKTQIELYESQAQMLEAIRDARYKTDEVYRAKVMEKIHASREAGIDLGI